CRRAGQVAAAAMELAQALGRKPEQSYAVLFDEFMAEEVVRALARTHAACGDPNQALAWAKQIGRSDNVKAKDDFEASGAVERRIHTLIGVAEGILDRPNRVRPEAPSP